jgi:cyclase
MKRAVFTLVALLSASTMLAQPSMTDVTIKAESVAPGVAVLFGQGGNIGVSYGPDGTILIDDQFAPLTPKILAAVAALGATPVKFLINTHWHGDHTGGNENLGNAGAIIMAHDNVRVRLAGGGTSGAGTSGARAIAKAPPVALPVVTYHDGLSLHLNGDEVRTIHMHDAHTDGDSVVHWKKANVVHMGDLLMTQGSMPYVDLGSGGNVRGFVAAADKVLAMTNAQTKIIPGHGPMATRADLQAWRNMIADVIAKVEEGIKAKKTLAQIQAMKPAARYEKPGTFISGDAFVAATYKSLTTPVAAHNHH